MKQDFLRCTAELLLTKNGPDEIKSSIIQFFENLSVLGRGELQIDTEEINIFISKTSCLVKDARRQLNRYLFDTEDILTNEFYGDEWITVCKRRSNIEFLRSMYHDYIDSDWNLIFLDCENLDDMLQQKGDFEGGLSESQIPAGIPPSHWWWWYPEKAPERGKE